jgi:hypothetical protein
VLRFCGALLIHKLSPLLGIKGSTTGKKDFFGMKNFKNIIAPLEI